MPSKLSRIICLYKSCERTARETIKKDAKVYKKERKAPRRKEEAKEEWPLLDRLPPSEGKDSLLEGLLCEELRPYISIDDNETMKITIYEIK